METLVNAMVTLSLSWDSCHVPGLYQVLHVHNCTSKRKKKKTTVSGTIRIPTSDDRTNLKRVSHLADSVLTASSLSPVHVPSLSLSCLPLACLPCYHNTTWSWEHSGNVGLFCRFAVHTAFAWDGSRLPEPLTTLTYITFWKADIYQILKPCSTTE